MNNLHLDVGQAADTETSAREWDLASVNGQELEAAQRVDRDWRQSRRNSTLGLLKRVEDRYAAGTDLLSRLGAVAGIVSVMGLMTIFVLGLVGGMHLLTAGVYLMTAGFLAILGLLALGGLYLLVRTGIERCIRLWARHQAIDLNSEGTEGD